MTIAVFIGFAGKNSIIGWDESRSSGPSMGLNEV